MELGIKVKIQDKNDTHYNKVGVVDQVEKEDNMFYVIFSSKSDGDWYFSHEVEPILNKQYLLLTLEERYNKK